MPPGSGNQRSGSHNNLLIQATPKTRRQYSLITWTFGRASVIWKIWPAVLVQTLCSAVVTTLTMRGIVNLRLPNFMLTVLGVVIGFIISYRASGGYERYWLGRSYWSDLVRNVRTMARLIWFHVPPRLTPRRTEEEVGYIDRPEEEMMQVMDEKMTSLDLLEGFAVSLKHHLRDELGIYYQDLYHLVRPLHDHPRGGSVFRSPFMPPPSRSKDKKAQPQSQHVTFSEGAVPPKGADSGNSYGTFDEAPVPPESPSSLDGQDSPLLAIVQAPKTSVLSKFSLDLIPFYSFFTRLRRATTRDDDVEQNGSSSGRRRRRLWRGPTYPGITCVVNQGDVLPLEILCHISNWFAVLEERGTVPGSSLGTMIGSIGMLEDTLSGLERMITTPLPFIYSVHIRQTVWIYLLLLPFQIVEKFGWFTIPASLMAAFIYLGFLSAGEEIEQPFGYDEDDLDLDLFCYEIHLDMEHLKGTRCINSYMAQEVELHGNTIWRQSAATVQES